VQPEPGEDRVDGRDHFGRQIEPELIGHRLQDGLAGGQKR
jgi:hypothetical protein